MALFISDTYTEAGTGTMDLNTHTPELGGTWVDHPHANYTTPFNLDRDTDRIFSIGTAAYYNDTVPSSADYYVQADFHHISTIAQNVAVCARMDTTADTMYLVRLDSGATWHMRQIVAGSALTIGSSTSQIPSVGNFTRGKFIVEGDQLSFYGNDVLLIGPITNTAVTAAGRAGVRNAGAASTTTGMHLDNFEAGDLIAAPGGGPTVNRVNKLRPAIFKPGLTR